MAAANHDAESVCPQHPERAAVARCRACLKPVCAACRLTVRGEEFCSKDCANNHFVSTARLELFEAGERTRRRQQVLRGILLLAIAFLCVAGAWLIWRQMFSADQRQTVRGWVDDARARARR